MKDRLSARNSLIRHTTSQLGAQSAPLAWIMNLTFCLLGGSVFLESFRRLRGFRFHQITLSVFSLSLIATAFFSHAPISEQIPFSELEDRLHSIFASLTGIAFTTAAVAAAFIEKGIYRRIFALFIAVSATLLSMLIFSVPDYAGIWQRGIFQFSFLWLIYFFNAYPA